PRYIVTNPDGSLGGYDANAPADEYGPSLTLGGYPITLLEHVDGIATYADMGVYHSPEAILKVTDSHGQVLYQTHPDQRARLAINPAVAFIMAQIMSDDNNRSLIFGPNSALHWKDRTVAAKTGTTDNFKDAVTVAFTPDLAVGLWVGDVLYTPPPGVVAGPNNSWYLADATSIAKLPGDNPPSPTPSASPFVVPPDPGGPVLASPSPSPCPSPKPPLPPPGC
ncbi:MAG: hypothetical protein E6I50_02090, partial [Chloroflexi bacterium]